MTDQSKTFPDYVKSALDTLRDYFIHDLWLHYQTNIEILTRFILLTARSCPTAKGSQLFHKLSQAESQPREYLVSMAQELANISGQIQGRKAPGIHDDIICNEALSAIRAIETWIPDIWPDPHPPVSDEVTNILDKETRYFRESTGR